MKEFLSRIRCRRECSFLQSQSILGTLTCDDFGDCGIGRSVIHLHGDSGVTDPSRLPIVYKGAWDSHQPQE